MRLGKVDQRTNEDNLEPQDVAVAEYIVHPQYNHLLKTHDIALLKLETGVRFSKYVKPVCLNQEWEIPSQLLVAAWGIRGNICNYFLLEIDILYTAET